MKILNFEQYKKKLEKSREEELYEKYEKVIWNIYDKSNSLKKILRCWPKLINNSLYNKEGDKLYMLNKKLNLIFRISYEKSEGYTDFIGWGRIDGTYTHFRLDYLGFRREKIGIKLIIEKPHKINYFLD